MIYIYIYRERERCLYIYIYTHRERERHSIVCVCVCVLECNGTMEYYSAIKRIKSCHFCSIMDGTIDYHTKWSKSEKDKSYMVSFICGV